MDLNTLQIVKIIRECKKSGVQNLKIGELEISFSNQIPEIPSKEVPMIKISEEAMIQVAEEAQEEEGFFVTDEMISEWEIHNPQEIERQILLGNLTQTVDGQIFPARKMSLEA